MVLFTTLLIMLAALALGVLTTVLTGGIAFIAVFGDLILCVVLIALIVKLVRYFTNK